jgi:biotin carboxyl carrier protein
MKAVVAENTISLIKSQNVWATSSDHQIKLIPRDSETLLLVTPSKVLTIRCIEINEENKTVTLLYNGQKFQTKLIEPLDDLLKSMGLENALTPKVSDLKAPMPGLVLQVLVEPGQEIKKGDKVLILEAMKMENAIKAPADVTVAQIHIAPGAAVDKNQLLITFQ